jgi:hypothetical protein
MFLDLRFFMWLTGRMAEVVERKHGVIWRRRATLLEGRLLYASIYDGVDALARAGPIVV